MNAIKPSRRLYWREYARKHRARKLMFHKRWYQRNRLKRLAQTRAYQQAHKEAYRERSRVYDATPSRRAKRNASTRVWRKAHPEANAAYHARRKARLRNPDVISEAKSTALIRAWKKQRVFTCYYCQLFFPTRQLHIDHIIPISKGGSHTVGNLCRSCDSCNLKKRDLLVEEILFNPQKLLPL